MERRAKCASSWSASMKCCILISSVENVQVMLLFSHTAFSFYFDVHCTTPNRREKKEEKKLPVVMFMTLCDVLVHAIVKNIVAFV